MERSNLPGKAMSFSNTAFYGASGSPTARLFVTPSIRKSDLDRPPRIEDDSSNNATENADQVFQDVDEFLGVLSAAGDGSTPPDVPDAVELLCKIVESRIAKYTSGENRNKFGRMNEEDDSLIDAVMRLSRLSNALRQFPAGSTAASSSNRIGTVLQLAMAFMEEELPNLLDDSRNGANSNDCKLFLFNAKDENAGSGREEKYPRFSPEVVTKIGRIATVMISAGYENEFCEAYTISRRNAFSEQMKKFDYERINVEDVQRMHWDTLEGEITRWIGVVKYCSETLFPGERRLADSVFSEHLSFSLSVFSNFVRAAAIQFIDFGEAVSMTKRSAEKLFKFMDIYERIRDLISAISESCSDVCRNEINHEIAAVRDRIGEAVVSVFSDLESSIRNDIARIPVPGGAVHPLTRYVMNYLEYACEYKDTLEHIFEKISKPEQPSPPGTDTPFSTQIIAVMDLLDANLQTKSMLYRDPALRDIFLMNNGRYILQKVKGCPKIRKLMGDNWCRRSSGIVRQYHKNYQRETWVRQCVRRDTQNTERLGGQRRAAPVGASGFRIGGGHSGLPRLLREV
ncbi:PREDICTED: exocyst complex component EXO70B1-like isoform X2 [Ipomoea nil]|uniref:exocyst complex component EXO70B1-like isoform X2 n=1 Tax=Ipomoea nil TaxID=35883 RepID=UPI0009010B13|nr:PREDICTED: exocyst complex component EXO70B1-like isoform X2 [Ipomoea nil]